MVVLTAPEKSALDEFSERVRRRFGARVRELLLFGSRARGDVHEDSDIDVCVVVDDITWQEAQDVDEITGDIFHHRCVLLSPIVWSTERMNLLRSRERTIALDIARDGVAL